MNLEEYNKYYYHFCEVNSAPTTWLNGRIAFTKAYSYYQEDWQMTLKLAQDFISVIRESN